MSGGSYSYICYKVEQECVGRMYDLELDDMMKDLVEVLRDLEWWDSGDIGEKQYREKAKEFKNKWFGNRKETNNQAVAEILKEAMDKINSL